MTTALIDVNEAFNVERAGMKASFEARIADGRLKPLPGGRFKITDPGSYDNGEVLNLRNGRLVPQHGLDETTGQAALYSAVPAWHALGNVVPDGVSDIDVVLKLGCIDFEVEKRPVLFQSELDGPVKIMPAQFVTERTDTKAGLGVVGARYETIQNRQVFEFLQDLVDRYDVVWESAGALRDGRTVFVSMRLPETVRIDSEGIDDEIVPFVMAYNSHDGSGGFGAVVSPWRPVCRNTERLAVQNALVRWGTRHTLNAADRVQEARATMKLSVNYYEQFAAEENALARSSMAIDEFHQVLDDLFQVPDEDASNKAKNAWTTRKSTLTELFDSNAERLGRTAYAAERALTEFADWKTAVRNTSGLRGGDLAVRATRVVEGAHDGFKNRAHKRLMLTVKR